MFAMMPACVFRAFVAGMNARAQRRWWRTAGLQWRCPLLLFASRMPCAQGCSHCAAWMCRRWGRTPQWPRRRRDGQSRRAEARRWCAGDRLRRVELAARGRGYVLLARRRRVLLCW